MEKLKIPTYSVADMDSVLNHYGIKQAVSEEVIGHVFTTLFWSFCSTPSIIRCYNAVAQLSGNVRYK